MLHVSTRTLTTRHDWIKPVGDDATIPRYEMPQIDDADIPTLLAYLGSLDIGFTAGLIDPLKVKSHQAIDRKKALAMPEKWMRTPSLISREPIVIDGNHRWYNPTAIGPGGPLRDDAGDRPELQDQSRRPRHRELARDAALSP